MNIIGVYLPYFNGSADQIDLYGETLQTLQVVLDSHQGEPLMVVGDMNASLPQQQPLARNWHRKQPFNVHSLMLFDFICDNDLCVGNFGFTQSVNYTYSKGRNTTYIDHVLIPRHLQHTLINCKIMNDSTYNTSDHLPIHSCVVINYEQTSNVPDVDHSSRIPVFPRLDWSDADMRDLYKQRLKVAVQELSHIHMNSITSRDEATAVVNGICDKLTSVLHNCCSDTSKPTNYSGKRAKKHWWNNNCSEAKTRVKLWYDIWTSCDRPREGHVYVSYKLAKKSYRKLCRQAMNRSSQNVVKLIDNMYFSHRSGKMWNIIRSIKSAKCNTYDAMDINSLDKYYCDKFKECDYTSSCISQCNVRVLSKYNNLESRVMSGVYFTEERLVRYIKSLRAGCAPGIDGILGEHLKHAIDCDEIIQQLCTMLSICLQFGVMPETSRKGLLIPLLKKPTSDPSIPKSYRPIVISNTYSKLLEMFVMEECGCHEFEDVQFGFVPGRGTNMAVSLTQDVISYCVKRGSPIYACSLDAEGAFDAIPHPVLFDKAIDVLPDVCWRLMYVHVLLGHIGSSSMEWQFR